MKVRTSELTGPALDWAVAKCEGYTNLHQSDYGLMMDSVRYAVELCNIAFSTDWSQGGPIIEREGVAIHKGNPLYFHNGNEHGDYYEPLWIAGKQHGPTPLIAAMRCYVASKLGDEVEIPEELV